MTTLQKPVRRRSSTRLGGEYGPDRGREIVVSIVPNPHGDLIELRPHGTRRSEVVLIAELYKTLLRRRIMAEAHARAKARKERRAAR